MSFGGSFGQALGGGSLGDILKEHANPETTVKPFLKAPDLTTGKVTDKLETYYLDTHAGIGPKTPDNPETTGRYRRRLGGAAVGAAGGAASGGGIIGIILGAAYGGYSAKKGKGQTKDYAVSFVVGYGAGSAVNAIGGAYSSGGLSGVLGAVGDWLSSFMQWLGIYSGVKNAMSKSGAEAYQDARNSYITPGASGAIGVDAQGNAYPFNPVAAKYGWGNVAILGVLIFLSNEVK